MASEVLTSLEVRSFFAFAVRALLETLFNTYNEEAATNSTAKIATLISDNNNRVRKDNGLLSRLNS